MGENAVGPTPAVTPASSGTTPAAATPSSTPNAPAAPAAPAPDQKGLDRLARFYRWNAKIYDYTRWAILRNRGRAFRRLTIPAGARLLDVGCGTGLNFPFILKQQSNLGRLWALDLSEAMLVVARRKIAAEPRLRDVSVAVQANAENYSLDEEFKKYGKPTIITYAYSLSMIPDWEASLRCSWNHLEPGGTMMILDFGDLRGWLWPFGKAFVKFLKTNHVRHFGAPWAEVLRTLTPHVDHRGVFGHYSVITFATKPAEGPSGLRTELVPGARGKETAIAGRMLGEHLTPPAN